jgi:hypothetical protein
VGSIPTACSKQERLHVKLLSTILLGLTLALAGCATVDSTRQEVGGQRQVVRILSESFGNCSGVMLSDGLILTAKHCAPLFKPEQVVKTSTFSDLMLVRSTERCPCVHLAKRAPNKVYVVGFPYGNVVQSQYVTEGYVQGFSTMEGERFTWLSAPAGPGNSGGAVLMVQDGEVVLVGVLVAGMTMGTVTAAVSYEDIKEFLNDYLKSVR